MNKRWPGILLVITLISSIYRGMQSVAHISNSSLRIIPVTTLAVYSPFVSNDKLCTLHLSNAFVEKTSHLNQWYEK
jgi:hypothetical protein